MMNNRVDPLAKLVRLFMLKNMFVSHTTNAKPVYGMGKFGSKSSTYIAYPKANPVANPASSEAATATSAMARLSQGRFSEARNCL